MKNQNSYIKDVYSTSATLKSNSFSIIGKFLLTLLTIWMGAILIFNDPPWTFLDNVSLIIHEAGHFVFSGFGELVQYMGGTIMQLLVPTLFAIYFLYKRNFFAFSFILFWIGNNLINIAVYIKDAQTKQLFLIGGGDHDWLYILSRLNILDKSEGLGSIVDATGTFFVLAGILLMLITTLVSIKGKSE